MQEKLKNYSTVLVILQPLRKASVPRLIGPLGTDNCGKLEQLFANPDLLQPDNLLQGAPARKGEEIRALLEHAL